METSKKWYQSTAIWGSLVSFVSLGLGITKGISIDATTQALIVDQTVSAVSVIGALGGNLAAIWGRANATKTIGVVPSPKP
jgi:hypothetical protein